MRTIIATLIGTGWLANLGLAQTNHFDDLKTAAPPAGWTTTQTGSGAAKWIIEKDATAPSEPNVLKQSSEATYPVCLKNDTSFKDGFVEVKFKAVAGKEDQAGGANTSVTGDGLHAGDEAVTGEIFESQTDVKNPFLPKFIRR